MKVGILIYAVGLLNNYLSDFLNNLNTYFLPGQRKKMYIFTNNKAKVRALGNDSEIELIEVLNKEPLYKYQCFNALKKQLREETEILIYFDVKLILTREVNTDLLPTKTTPLLVHKKSDKIDCMIQGGLTKYFLRLINYVASKIESDDKDNLLNTNNYHYLQYLAANKISQKLITTNFIVNLKTYNQPYITCELSGDIYLLLKQLYLMLEAEHITGKKFILHNQHLKIVSYQYFFLIFSKFYVSQSR